MGSQTKRQQSVTLKACTGDKTQLGTTGLPLNKCYNGTFYESYK